MKFLQTYEMRKMKSAFSFLLSLLLIFQALGPGFFALKIVNAANASANLDQCRNGGATSPQDCTGSAWVNGNAGSSNSHYIEGHSIPYRVVMTNLSLGSHTVNIEWDITKGGKHAVDFITSYNRLQPHSVFGHAAEAVNPIGGLSGSFGSPSTFNIPAPSSAGSPVVNQPATTFNNLPLSERQMSVWNGTITSMSYVSQGNLASSDSSSQIQVTFNATSPTVVLSWGGHIATPITWGAGNSAGGISGSPYHTRLISLDGSGGNQDRSLSAGAITVGELVVAKHVINDNGGTTGASSFTLNISGVNASPPSVAGSEGGVPVQLDPGAYSVTEGSHDGYSVSYSAGCTGTIVAGQENVCVVTNDDNPAPPPPVLGCTSPTATNYNPNATQDDGSCIFPVPGCTNPAATNYNPNATVDDNSCVFPPPPVAGCMDSSATNFNPNATEDDGSCTFPILGCTNPAATNYNSEATPGNADAANCTFPVLGCTNPAATNFNLNATQDDGSCIFPVPGCTNPAATNYNALATVDDGSCTLPPPPPNPTADLELTKGVNDQSVDQNQQIIYTVTVKNHGPDTATNVVVTDVLPVGLTYVSDDSSGAYNTSNGSWTIGTLTNGATATLNMTVTVNASTGTVTNQAAVNLDPNIDINSSNNSASIDVTVNRTVTTSTSGGGGGGGQVSFGGGGGLVLGATSSSAPAPQVLGASTGLPDTGLGPIGESSNAMYGGIAFALLLLLGLNTLSFRVLKLHNYKR
jgi:uncharacterized repeat protein (TIGR01451 family)